MCEPGEQVLSDVHLNVTPSSELSNEEKAVTRFYFKIPSNSTNTLRLCASSISQEQPDTTDNDSLVSRQYAASNEEELVTMTTVDEDGDLVVMRKKQPDEENVVVIEHAMATTINDVGLQVWQGCLLLCDFLLNNPKMFRGQVALELGAGVGLGSIIMSTMASFVFCTDIGTSVLEMCQRNVANNQHLFGNDEIGDRHGIQVRELDWFQSTKIINHSGPFQFDDKDRKKVGEVTVIIAADVIYDDDLTDAFFSTLHWLMTTGKEKTAFIALEKRLNFTMDDHDVTCKAYDYYRKHVTRLVSLQAPDVRYSMEQLPVDFIQCFQYTRTEQLELWQIKTVRSNTEPD